MTTNWAALRREVLDQAAARGHALYTAEGGFMNMNGNYTAGVLEGIVHFHPEVRHWLLDITDKMVTGQHDRT